MTSALTLGQYLASIRADRHLTLRQVEEATSKLVSNAYLSQIENDKIRQPSPNILHALAGIYAVDYAGLMERSGHIMPTTARRQDRKHGHIFSSYHLTSEEEAELIDYLKFIRLRKRSCNKINK